MDKTVYIVLHTLSIGGAERHASSIANHLFRYGHQVKIVLLQDHIVDYELEDGIEVISLTDTEYSERIKDVKVGLADKILLKTYRLVSQKRYHYLDRKLYIWAQYIRKLEFYFSKQENIDQGIVISFMPIPNISAAALKNKFGFKLILGEFNSPQLEFAADAPENRLKREYFPDADGFVFQTHEQEEFYSYLETIEKKIIPNPVEDIRILPFYGKRKKEIVNYCRHAKAKNLPLLIAAFSRLVKEYPDYTLVIYGDGPERKNTEKCIEEHGISDKVLLKPYAQNVLELVRESAMFVSSSDREGISNSMLEAMAIGLPTVCTDCPAGGARMFIEPYKNGIIVPVRNPDALYKAMKYMIDHPEDAQEMSRNAVAIRETLEKNKILEQWRAFVEGV